MKKLYSISEEERDRINIIKFIAIILVLFKHAHMTATTFGGNVTSLKISQWLVTYQTCVSDIIARVSVPAFFSYFLFILL